METIEEKEYINFFIELNQERAKICYYLDKMTADFQSGARQSWGRKLRQVEYDIKKFTEILLHKFEEKLFTDYIEEVSGKVTVFQRPKWDTKEGRGLYYIIKKRRK